MLCKAVYVIDETSFSLTAFFYSLYDCKNLCMGETFRMLVVQWTFHTTQCCCDYWMQILPLFTRASGKLDACPDIRIEKVGFLCSQFHIAHDNLLLLHSASSQLCNARTPKLPDIA